MAHYSIVDSGAVGDGITNDAAAIQKAIDTCASNGGGTVLVPAGKTFLSGSFDLKSNIEFHVERGARLISATHEEDFPHRAFDSGPEAGKRVWIRAIEAHNIALTGGGEIDGRCLEFKTGEQAHIFRTLPWRPAMTCFVGCRNIRVRDITLKDSANWALHFTGCEDIVVHGITIRNNLKFPNCDGIDPDHCRNVRISDCHIEAGDDCIVLKNTAPFAQYGPTENVTVTGCTLISTSAAIKIGTESASDFRNIVFDSCVVSSSNRGLAIQLRDGGNVENVIFSNMVVETRLFDGGWWGKSEPIYVSAFHRTEGSALGKIRNVRFVNILCRSENGAFLSGSDDSILKDILLDNVSIELKKWTRWQGGKHDRRPCSMEGVIDHPTAGVYAANAHGLTIRNCNVAWAENPPEYFRHALETNHVEGLEVENFKGSGARAGVEARVIG